MKRIKNFIQSGTGKKFCFYAGLIVLAGVVLFLVLVGYHEFKSPGLLA